MPGPVARPPHRYAALLSAPGVPAFVSAGLLARLPLGMTPLALLLLVREEGRSYGAAGAVLAAYTLAAAVSAPALGRLVDRVGQTAVLVVAGSAYPAALAAVTVAAGAGAPLLAVAACTALAGVALPPIGACIRALWPQLAPPGLRDTAYALEAALQEVFFVVGPLLVAGLAAAASPATAVLAAGALGAAGTLAFAATPPSRRWRRAAVAEPHWLGALGAPGVRTVLLASAAMGSAFGMVELAMPAFAEEHGSGRAAGGIALAAFSLGSLVGGLVAGALPSPRDPARRYAGALALLAAALALPLLAGSLPVFALLFFLAGLPIAPAFAMAYTLIDDRALPGTTTEAFAWNSTAIVSGVSVGAALAGVTVEAAGVSAALALATGFVAVGALAVTARRPTLAAPLDDLRGSGRDVLASGLS